MMNESEQTKSPVLLCIETTAEVCSVALAKGMELIGEWESEPGRNHAATIGSFAQKALQSANTAGLKLEAIAVSEGPGSYTGLRIGASFAKGLAFGCNIPIIAVSTLRSMTDGFTEGLTYTPDALFCPMIDAGRMEVYTALYQTNGAVETEEQAMIVDEASFSDQYSQREVYFFGSGATKCKEVIKLPNAHFDAYAPHARDLRKEALVAFSKGHFVDTAYWTPNYLKPYIAKKAKNKVLNR